MSQMIRTRADNKKWEKLFEEFGIDLKFSVASRFIDRAIDLVHPVIDREADDVWQATVSKASELVDLLEVGMSINAHAAVTKSGLEPTRSNLARMRLFLKENELLQYSGPREEEFVKRIAPPKPTNGSDSESPV
jgi:hypothetical protein